MASLEQILADPNTRVEEEQRSIRIPFPTPRKAYKNIEMEQMIAACEPLLDRTDLIGYAAARNTRILRECATEYFARREELIRKYGEPEIGDDGKSTGRTSLSFSSPHFAEYSDEIVQWAEIEHEPELFRIPASKAIGKLSGREILQLDWMLEEE